MDQHPVKDTPKRSLFKRVLLMIVMAIAYQVSGTLLFIVAMVQIAFSLFTDHPSTHLFAFSRSLGLYFQQIANFQTFTTEEVPFPFSDWPSSTQGPY